MIQDYSWIALNVAAVSCLACLLALTVNCLLGPPYSRQRYLGYWSAIVLCLLSPLPSLGLQSRGIGWFQSTTAQLNAEIEATATRSSTSVPDPIESIVISAQAVTTETATSHDPTKIEPSPGLEPQSRVEQVAFPEEDSSTRSTSTNALERLTQYCLSLWLIGIVICIWRLLSELVYLRRLSSSLESPRCIDAQLRDELQQHCGFEPFIRQSALVQSPTTFGMWRPVIVVPVQIGGWLERRELLAVLLHECAHVARRDTRATFVQACAATLFWWNPLVHLVNRNLQSIREVLCDDYVRRVSSLQAALAEGMVKLAEQAILDRSSSLCTGFFGTRQSIRERIERLINGNMLENEHGRGRRVLSAGLYAASLALICVPVIVPSTRSVAAQDTIKNAQQNPPKDIFTLTGSIQDDGGKPLPGMDVWMLVVSKGSDRQRHWERTQTDKSGGFEFQTEHEGSVSVTATGKGYCWASNHMVEARHGTRDDRTRFVLTSARKVELLIEDEAGDPIEDAEVDQLGWELDDNQPHWLLTNLGADSGIAMPVQREGNKLIVDKLPQGAQIVARVTCPGRALSAVSIGARESLPKTVVMRRGYPLHISVRKLPSNEPVPNQDVRVSYYAHEDLKQILFRSVKTDQEGKCTFWVGHAHYLDVRLEHPELVSRTWHSFTEWGEKPTQKSLTLELWEKAKVRGRVVEAGTLEPLAEVGVGIIVSPGQIYTSTTTDENGYYELEGAVGPAEIVPSYGTGVYIDENAKVSVELKAGEIVQASQDLVLRPLPPLTGIVTENGKPVENAIVFQGFGSTRAVTDRQGRFTFPVSNQGLQFLEAVHLAGNVSGAAAITHEMIGQAEAILIELEPNSELRGRIADWNPKDETPREIYLTRQISAGGGAQSSNAGTAAINPRGEFAFRGLNRAFDYKLSPRLMDHHNNALPWLTLKNPVEQLEPLSGVDLAEVHRSDRVVISGTSQWNCQDWYNSSPLSLDQLKGKVVLLHFFNSTHKTSSADLRYYNAIYEGYSNKGLTVIGIHRHTEAFDSAIQLAKSVNVGYPIAQDNSEGASAKFFKLDSSPASYLIDKSGKVYVPNKDAFRLLQQIDRMLSE